MRKNLLILGIGAALSLPTMQAGMFQRFGASTVTGLSTDGEYAVGTGFNVEDDNAVYKSYLYRNSTGSVEWLTEIGSPEKSGMFMGVNSKGTIAGARFDKDHPIQADNLGSDWDGYLTVATVWVDGVAKELGYASRAVSDFTNAYNGTIACSVSEDESIVNGVVYDGVSYCSEVVQWKKGDDGSYVYNSLPKLGGTYFSSDLLCSADGQVVVGEAKIQSLNGRGNIVWSPAGDYVFNPLDTPNANYAHIYAVSPDGHYGIYFIYDETGSERLCLWDFEKAENAWVLPLPEGTDSCDGLTVTNDGSGFCLVNNALWYYSRKQEQMVSAYAYFTAFDSLPLTDDFTVSQLCDSMITRTSADGSAVLGYTGSYEQGNMNGYYLQVDMSALTLVSAVQGLEAFYSSPTELSIRWKPATVPDDCTLKCYKIYIGGEETEVLESELTTDGDGKLRYRVEQTPGKAMYVSVRPVCLKGEREIVGDSANKVVQMSANTEYFFYDDFNNVDQDSMGNLYYLGDDVTMGTDRGNYVIQWHLDAGNYANNTPFWTTTSLSGDSWNSYLDTRYLDGRTLTDDSYLVFYLLKKIVAGSVETSSDTFKVQWTEDGYTWNDFWSVNSADYKKNKWNFYALDMKELKGKLFRLRFVAEGEGVGQPIWNIDYIGVKKDEQAPAPQAVRSHEKDGGMLVEWTNENDLYELSYLRDHPVVGEQSVGNECEPLQVAVKFTPEMMSPYVGMQISTVSKLVFDYIQNQSECTLTEAIVYENGKEVTRETFDAPASMMDQVYQMEYVELSKPVTVKKGSTYMVALRISNYGGLNVKAGPIWYQINKDACVPGYSDLYSQDEGKTWLLMSDLYEDEAYAETYGYAIWPIRVGFRAAGEEPKALIQGANVWGYNLYRDGEKINEQTIYYPHPRYFDAAGTKESKYTVESFSLDGTVSVKSGEAKFSAVEELAADGDLEVLTLGDGLAVLGDFTLVEVWNLHGVKVAELGSTERQLRGLHPGLYLLKGTKADGTSATAKVMVK